MRAHSYIIIRFNLLYFQGASFAIGNAVFHSSELVQRLSGSIPFLRTLLSDQSAKIRSHAAGELLLVLLILYESCSYVLFINIIIISFL